jgi:hypothetical protein
MSKKTDLMTAMQKATGQTPKPINVAANTEEKPKKQTILPPSREGKKSVVGYFDSAVSKQLKQIALDEETSVQDLLREAINDLFVKKSKPPIA